MKVIRTLLVICMVTLFALQTTASSNAQELPPLSEQEFFQEGWRTWRGQGTWESATLKPMLGAEPIVPHPTVSLRGDTMKLYVAYFGMQGCSGCITMAPRMDELRKKGWTVYKFDARLHRLAVSKLLDPNDRSLPKMVIMNEGQPVEIISGTPTVDELVNKLERIKNPDTEDETDDIDDDDSGLPRKVDYDLFG